MRWPSPGISNIIPRWKRVLYPGLAAHPGHDVAKRQMTDGFGGMLSILVKGELDAKPPGCAPRSR